MDEAVRPGGGRWNWKGLSASDDAAGDGMDVLEQADALRFALAAVLCAATNASHSGTERSFHRGRDWADLSDTDEEDWSHVTAGSAG